MTTEKLLSAPPSNWDAYQVIVFDWHDGPRSGICQMRTPAVEFLFTLLEERQTDDDLDDRLFAVKSIPDGSVEKIVRTLSFLGPPTRPIWVPNWNEDKEPRLKTADNEIDNVLRAATESGLIIRTPDFKRFFGIWASDTTNPTRNWFDALGI
jgi:hypothetical protein